MVGSIAQGLRNHDEQIVGVFYSRYVPCIYSYAYTRLKDEASAQDVAHDSVLAVVRNIDQLVDDAKFDAWLWAIVRHEVVSSLRTRQRVVSLSEILERRFEVRYVEQIEDELVPHVVRNSLQGLTPRDQEIFLLLVEGDLSASDLAVVLGVSQVNAQKIITRVRHRASRSTRALDAALYEKRCVELTHVTAQWNGVFNPVWRKRISHHVESCAVCGKRKLVSLT